MPVTLDPKAIGEDISRIGNQAKIERWFPPTYPRDPAERLKVRQEAQRRYVFEAVKTVDEHEQTASPLKPLPRLPHLEMWLDLMLSERILLDPKSRQNFMTWGTLAGLSWRIGERPRVNIGYVTKKLEDGQRHVESRLKSAIWMSLPEYVRDQFQVADHKGALHLVEKRIGSKWVPWNSRIIAFPQGADQLRSETFTIVFWDEIAYCCTPEAWRAVAPTIMVRGDSFGQLIGVSSVRRGSFFNATLIEPWNFRRARQVARYGQEEAA